MMVLISQGALLRSILRHVKTTDPTIGRAAAVALRRFRSSEARVGLLHLLHHPDRAVVLTAIEGLRAIGTVDEIEHLAAVGAGWFGDRGLRAAAREAIARIQARSRGVPGSLSVASPERGALSLDSLDRTPPGGYLRA